MTDTTLYMRGERAKRKNITLHILGLFRLQNLPAFRQLFRYTYVSIFVITEAAERDFTLYKKNLWI